MLRNPLLSNATKEPQCPVVHRPVTRRLVKALEAGSDVEVANPQAEGLNGSNTSNPTDAAVPPPVIRQARSATAK
ncbi:hypothetical protein ACLKA6_017946 [Drosophila palustris]